jgi:hypothetical protein
MEQRSASRDARKHHRKEKERVKGKSRQHDRRVKEGALRDEEDDLLAVAANPPSPPESRMDAQLVLRLRRELQWVCDARVTRRDRLLALAMCRHQRLGKDSPARVLSRDVLTVIAQFVPGTVVIVGGGLEIFRREDEDEEDDPFDRNDYKPSLAVWEWDGHRSWQRFPDLPEPMAECHFLFVPQHQEVWGVGGRDSKTYEPYGHAWVLSLKNNTWRRVPDVVNPPRRGGRSVVYKNVILTIGGRTRDGEPVPDSIFVLSGVSPWKKWPERMMTDSSHSVSCHLLRDLLIVVCGRGDSRGEAPSFSSVLVDLSEQFPKCFPFPSFSHGLEWCPIVLDDQLYFAGAYVDTGCPTCSYPSAGMWKLDFDELKWVELERSRLPTSLCRGSPVYTADSVQICGGHTGTFWDSGYYGCQAFVFRLKPDRMKWRGIVEHRRDLQKITPQDCSGAVMFPTRLSYAGVVQIGQ